MKKYKDLYDSMSMNQLRGLLSETEDTIIKSGVPRETIEEYKTNLIAILERSEK